MSDTNTALTRLITQPQSEAERIEMARLGLLDEQGRAIPFWDLPDTNGQRDHITKHPITNHGVLNEAYAYDKPSSFSRGLRVDIRSGMSVLYISGTASIDDEGVTLYRGDLRAQCWRTWRNITELLQSEGADWHDIVRTTCYLRDIERDYDFFKAMRLDPLPASTGIQARLCREDLLVEIEAIAILQAERNR